MKHGSIAIFALGCMVIIAAMFGRYEIQVQGPGAAFGTKDVIYRIDRFAGTVETCHPALVNHQIDLDIEIDPTEDLEGYAGEMRRRTGYKQPSWCRARLPGN